MLNDLVNILLAHAQGIDPDRQDKGSRKSLNWAAEYGHVNVVKALLSDGRVDPNPQDEGGQTPLSYAARYMVVPRLSKLCNI